jgi:flagellar protein FliO/FliZ
MLLALGVVLIVMWLLARWARKPLGGKTDRVMSVLARQQISRSASVMVLRVMDRALVLGVTEQGIRLITETDLDEVELVLAMPVATKSTWPRFTAADQDAPSGLEPAEPEKRGALDGSVFSAKTWRQLINAARDLTVRR